MNKIIAFLLLLSFFACKKEEKNVVQVQSIDSTVYYNKWTKMNKVSLSFGGDITDVSYQPNKSMALLNNNKVFFVDSNFNLKTSPNFLNYSGNYFMKFQTVTGFPNFKNTFYYFINPQSGTSSTSQVIIENNLYGTEILNNFYTRSYFIKDTNQNNYYSFIGYGHDYFAYNIYNTSGYNYLLNYRNYTKKIDTAISILSNVGFNSTFRLGNNVVFWKDGSNEFTTINTNSFEVQTGMNISNDYRLIGVFNNQAYFHNFITREIYKTRDLLNVKLVYKYNLLSEILPYFNEKFMLILGYSNDNKYLFNELTLLNIESESVEIFSTPFAVDEEIKCHWVIDNTLYILTSTNIYARKF